MRHCPGDGGTRGVGGDSDGQRLRQLGLFEITGALIVIDDADDDDIDDELKGSLPSRARVQT